MVHESGYDWASLQFFSSKQDSEHQHLSCKPRNMHALSSSTHAAGNDAANGSVPNSSVSARVAHWKMLVLGFGLALLVSVVIGALVFFSIRSPNPDKPVPYRLPGALPLDPAGDSSPDPAELRSVGLR